MGSGPRRRWPLLAAFALALGALLLAPKAAAGYQIESLYSDLTGFAQAIELRENSADGKIAPLAGATVTVTSGNVVKRFIIPTDPPPGFPAGGTLLLTSIDEDVGDYVLPELFLPTAGGTIDLDGQDPWTFGPLPTDGDTKLLRSGATADAVVHSFTFGAIRLYFEFASAVEYYAPSLDHYFISASQPDIDALESGRIPGWVETGQALAVFGRPYPRYCCSMYGQVAVPVCRYYIPPPIDSHFFSAFAEECDAIPEKFPSLILETRTAFYVILPDAVTGQCPYPFQPVYRLWNQRADSNHRYVSDLALRAQMIAQGWTPEGKGPEAVVWCY